jgi:hypothetical protein
LAYATVDSEGWKSRSTRFAELVAERAKVELRSSALDEDGTAELSSAHFDHSDR